MMISRDLQRGLDHSYMIWAACCILRCLCSWCWRWGHTSSNNYLHFHCMSIIQNIWGTKEQLILVFTCHLEEKQKKFLNWICENIQICTAWQKWEFWYFQHHVVLKSDWWFNASDKSLLIILIDALTRYHRATPLSKYYKTKWEWMRHNNFQTDAQFGPVCLIKI